MRTTIIKAFTIVTLIVAAVLLGLYHFSGCEMTLSACGYALLIAAMVSAIVMAIWFAVGLWICEPIARFISKTFETIGR